MPQAPTADPQANEEDQRTQRVRSYRVRMVTGMLLVIIPMILILITTMTVVGSHTVEDAISRTSQERAVAGAARIEDWIQERTHDVERLQIAVAPVLDDAEAMVAILSRAQENDVGFEVLQVTDENGAVLASGQATRALDPVGRSWFVETVGGGETISGIYRDGDSLRLVISRPVTDDTGTVVAVVMGDLRVEEVARLVGDADFAEDAEILVSSPSAKLIYTTDSGAPESGTQLLIDGALATDLDERTVERALEVGEGSSRYEDYKGVEVLAGFARVPAVDFVVLAKAPLTQALAGERRVLLVGLLLGLGGVAVLVIFSVVFAGRESAYLRQLTAVTEDAAAELRQQAESMSTSAVELASTTNEQSAAVTETSTTMEELSRSAAQIAETSKDVADQTSLTRDNLERAETEIQESSRQTLALAEGVGRISEILALINELADQTDMLALNAAIEAARAGEAGEGFAVVADEVRRLAERSKSSSADIAQIIAATEQQMNATLLTMEGGAKQMHIGLDLLQDVTLAAEQVRQTTLQQLSATDQVVESMTLASEAASQVAQTADTIAEGATRMADTAEALEQSASDSRRRF